MSERDVMALLAEANPVRVDALPQSKLTGDSILARRRRPSSRVVLIAAVLLAGVAVTLIGVFALGGSHRDLKAHGPHRSPATKLFGPGVADLHVGSVAAADALLPFRVVLPSAQ